MLFLSYFQYLAPDINSRLSIYTEWMESMSLASQQFPGVKDHSVSTEIVATWRPMNENSLTKANHVHSTAGNDTNTKQHLQILRLCRAERRKNKDRLGLLKMWLQVMLDGYLVLQGKACCLKQLWSLWTLQVDLFPIKKLFIYFKAWSYQLLINLPEVEAVHCGRLHRAPWQRVCCFPYLDLR